jgi:diguanylate cyclase (GGDEF)-like protein
VVFQILDDGRGRLWMSTQAGIASVARRDFELYDIDRLDRLRFDLLARSEGLRTSACNGPAAPAGAEDLEGRLVFPTIKGLAIVDPDAIPFNDVPPPITIEKVVVDGREHPASSELVLEPGVDRVEFQFTALSLLAPERVRFRFQLVGNDDDWSEPSVDRRAHYTNLPPGDYTFRVIACNNDGVWNEQGAAVHLTLEPYVYQTRPFLAACALGIFLLGLGVAMIRVRALKQRGRTLAALVQERTRELDAANQELARMARVDGLTGIANRRHFEEFFGREWRRCRRHGDPISVIMIDIDEFKKYNDHYGHQAGDGCLRTVARIAGRTVRRPGDLVARYGGEEFVVVLSGASEEGALGLAEKIRAELFQAAIPHHGGPHGRVSLSAGVATVIPARDGDPQEVIRRADAALYRAKRGGRNRVVQAEPDQSSELADTTGA